MWRTGKPIGGRAKGADRSSQVSVAPRTAGLTVVVASQVICQTLGFASPASALAAPATNKRQPSRKSQRGGRSKPSRREEEEDEGLDLVWVQCCACRKWRLAYAYDESLKGDWICTDEFWSNALDEWKIGCGWTADTPDEGLEEDGDEGEASRVAAFVVPNSGNLVIWAYQEEPEEAKIRRLRWRKRQQPPPPSQQQQQQQHAPPPPQPQHPEGEWRAPPTPVALRPALAPHFTASPVYPSTLVPPLSAFAGPPLRPLQPLLPLATPVWTEAPRMLPGVDPSLQSPSLTFAIVPFIDSILEKVPPMYMPAFLEKRYQIISGALPDQLWAVMELKIMLKQQPPALELERILNGWPLWSTYMPILNRQFFNMQQQHQQQQQQR